MKILKSLAAYSLIIVLIFSFSACHPKDEVAMTIGDVQITSALYMCALIQADGEARNLIDKNAAEGVENIDYFKQKIEGADYTDWVKNRAEEICKEYAAYELKFAEAGLEISEDTQSEIDFYTDYYWNTAGLGKFYEKNGVAFQTYKKFFTYSYKAREYFESIYGKDGTNPVSEEELKSAMDENFVLVNQLYASYTDTDGNDLSDDAKAEIKQKFESYVTRLNNGESFETIYNEYNATDDNDENDDNNQDGQDASGQPEESTTSNEDESDNTDDTPKPQDKNAIILGDSDTNFASEIFSDVKAMSPGEVKIIEPSSSTGIYLIVRKDILSDPYYLDYLNLEILKLLKQTEFENMIKEYANSLQFNKNNYAVNRFKVKKIVQYEDVYNE
ncbi:MAG TPA: hypothetical protein GXX17_07190 [Clostridiales bacterium]|nr:hypothetical protein [Clostridiales bacterium]